MSPIQGGEASGRKAGLFAALKNIAATLLATGRTRLELLGSEFEEEKLRAIRLLIAALAMVFCLGVAALLVVGLLAIVFWESRVLVVGGLAGLFLLLGGVFYTMLTRAAKRTQPPFASTLAELEEDLHQLKAAARNDPATD